jgi:hypothetical protein
MSTQIKKNANVSAAAAATQACNAIETSAFIASKGTTELVRDLIAAYRLKMNEKTLYPHVMVPALAYRLNASAVSPMHELTATSGDNERKAWGALYDKAKAILTMSRPADDPAKATDKHRSGAEQTAYDAAKKIWQRANMTAQVAAGLRAAPTKAPQPAKAAMSGEDKPKGEDKETMAAPINFAEFVKRPPVLTTPQAAVDMARNLAALMSAELKQSAKALPGDVRAMFVAFNKAAMALEDVSK